MKLTNSLKSLAFFLLFSLLVYSCKRDVQPAAKPKEAAPSVNLNIPQEILDKVKAEGRGYTIYMNVPTKGYASDNEGNPIVKANQIAPGNSQRTLTDPSVCADPASYVDNAAITSVQVVYVCGSGYKFTIKWRISTYFTLVTTNPINSTQLSRGRIQLKNNSGVNVYQNLTITPVTLTNVGTDPTDPSATLYDFSYTTPFISSTVMNQTVTINNAYYIFTDCGSNDARSTAFTPVNALATTQVTTPCARVDDVQIIPQSPAPGFNGYISGSDPSFACGDTYTHNTTSYVQYRKKPSTTWLKLPMYEAGNPTVRTTGQIYYWEVLYLNLPTGTYEFKWQNTYGNPNTCTNAPVSAILTKTF